MGGAKAVDMIRLGQLGECGPHTCLFSALLGLDLRIEGAVPSQFSRLAVCMHVYDRESESTPLTSSTARR